MRPLSILLLLLLVGCPSPPPEPIPAPKPARATPAPPTSVAEAPGASSNLTRLAALTSSPDCSIEARTGLMTLAAQFPSDTSIDEPLLAALKGCSDWSSMAELLDTRAGTDTDVGALVRAKYHIKSKGFDRAIALLRPLAEADPADTEVAWALGLALFDGGQRAHAMPYIDRVANPRADAGRADGLILQGLSKLDTGDPAGALPVLERATTVEPANPAGWNALGRARARAGDDPGADAAFDEAANRHAAITAAEAASFRISGLVTALKRAYADRRFADTQQLIDEVLPLAPPKLKASLWEIRASILQSTGDAAGAADAAKRAQSWAQAAGAPQ